MKALVTGATGFVGGRVAAKLSARGDEVVALVRSPARAAALEALGCKLVEGDLRDTPAIVRATAGCDAVFHLAGMYRIGISGRDRDAMFEANVYGTERVLNAAIEAGVAKIVHVSTVGVFGNTHGRVVDETHVRPDNDFLSCYDETKFLAHRYAQARIDRGAPIVIVQPGGVYGPGDHSEVGSQIERARRGELKFKVFPDLGFNLVFVDDAAQGIVLAHDRGRMGQSFVVGGEIATLGELVDRVSRKEGRKPPSLTLPTGLLRLLAPLGPVLGPAMGVGPDLREVIRTSDHVTYWATDVKARRELGYRPRDLDAGLSDLLAA